MLCSSTPKQRHLKGKGIRPGDEVDGTPKYLEDERNRSILAIGTESTSFDSVLIEDAFESTQIKIQLLGLTSGIVMETTGREARKIKTNKSKALGDEPVFAVVTGFHEVAGKGVVIGSHLPSIPIEKQTDSKGKKHKLMALWPADFDPNQGTQTSSVTFTRKVKKAPIPSLESVQQSNTKTRMYTSESLHLTLSLMRGKEIKTVGIVCVHFTGAESKPTQMNLPVKVTKYAVKKAIAQMKGEKMKRKHSMKKLKPLKPVTFKGDPSRSYRLGEDSILSLVIETSKNEDFQAHDIIANGTSSPKTDFFTNLKCGLTQQDILLDLVLSSELLEDSDDEDDHEDTASNPSDESPDNSSEREETEFDDLADLFSINIDNSAQAFFANTSISVDTPSARIVKPGDLPPSSAFSPLSWMPSPQDIVKKFVFNNDGAAEI